jgi:hypothetical protein
MSRLLSLVLAAAAGAAALAVTTMPAAVAQPSHGNVCFRLGNVQGSKLADPRTLYLRADGGRTFRIGFSADCNTGGSYSLILHPVDNSGEVCQAIGLYIAVRDTGERCVPTSLQRLSPEEAAAIPPRDRP